MNQTELVNQRGERCALCYLTRYGRAFSSLFCVGVVVVCFFFFFLSQTFCVSEYVGKVQWDIPLSLTSLVEQHQNQSWWFCFRI